MGLHFLITLKILCQEKNSLISRSSNHPKIIRKGEKIYDFRWICFKEKNKRKEAKKGII